MTCTEPAGTIREQEFNAFSGRLVGRPDVIRDSEVVDYKSGAILEHDAATQTDVVKASYVRQLRIYGYLVKQALGWWPQRGILLPLGGPGVEVALEPSECEREANEAIALLDSYESKLKAAMAPGDLATPSPDGCRWCPYKLICPSFWQASTPAWSGQLDGAALEGTLDREPTPIRDGTARAIAIDIQAGSEERGRTQIAPLNLSTHASVSGLVTGDRVRLVGLRARGDGVLVPTQRTILARVVDLPEIGLGSTS